MSDTTYLTAAELTKAYATKTLSPIEATRQVIDRLHAVNDEIVAFNVVLSDAALTQAAASERRWQIGLPRGPLDGVPVSIKDGAMMKGLPTRKGSRTTPEGPSPENAPTVDRLLEAGAVLFGKTTLPDNAVKGITDSPLTGITRNPWNLAMTPGGSSGGASAALAAGVGPLALGSDGAGSIRIPSSFAGVAGIKPTWGRVAMHPGSPFEGMSHYGPMGRTVADVGAMLTVLAKPDIRDGFSTDGPPPYHPRARLSDLDRIRVAVTTDFGLGVDVQPDVADAVVAAGEVLRSLGAQVTEADPDLSESVEALQVLWNAGVAKVYHATPEDKRELFDPDLVEMARRGEQVSGADYVAACYFKQLLAERMGYFHRDHDILIGPTMPIVAFEAGRLSPEGYDQSDWTSWSPFCAPFNMTQQPAASIPCGLSNGLPIGLHIIGRRNEDALVLRVAEAYERAAGGFNDLSDRGRALALNRA